jgi:hypothetical protein
LFIVTDDGYGSKDIVFNMDQITEIRKPENESERKIYNELVSMYGANLPLKLTKKEIDMRGGNSYGNIYRSHSILSPPGVGENLVKRQCLDTGFLAQCLRYKPTLTEPDNIIKFQTYKSTDDKITIGSAYINAYVRL